MDEVPGKGQSPFAPASGREWYGDDSVAALRPNRGPAMAEENEARMLRRIVMAILPNRVLNPILGIS